MQKGVREEGAGQERRPEQNKGDGKVSETTTVVGGRNVVRCRSRAQQWTRSHGDTQNEKPGRTGQISSRLGHGWMQLQSRKAVGQETHEEMGFRGEDQAI